jgi:hypothetical protein
MKKCRQFACVLAGFAAFALLPLAARGGDGGGNDSAAVAIKVTITPATATLDGGGKQLFTATVANDSAHAGVKWKVTGGGTLSTLSSTTPPFKSTYTAPATVSAVTKVTVTATSKTDPSKSASAKITVYPISVTIPTKPEAIAGDASEAIAAKVMHGGAMAGVTWKIASGGGSLSDLTTRSATYTAPLPVKTGSAVVKAASKTDPTKTASIAIPLIAIKVDAIKPAAVSLGGGGSQAFAVTVANDPSNSGVRWSIGSGEGTLKGATKKSVTYLAPAEVIGTSTIAVKLRATSIKDPTKSASAIITLTPPSSPPSQWVYYDSSGKLLYKPLDAQGDKIMDFSTAGYEQGAKPIPTAPVEATVSPSGGDDTANIQAAINTVSAMTLNATTGLRGAVLLEPGSYTVSGSLTITASGVVLRGSGSGTSPGTNTVITMAEAATPYPLVVLGTKGNEPTYVGSLTNITDAYVPAGTLTVDVASTAGLEAGSNIIIERPVTAAWETFMGMTAADLGTTCSGSPCNWIDVGNHGLKTDRTITAIDGNRITLDAPMSDSIDSTYCGVNGAVLQAYTFSGRISQVGVENLRAIAPPPPDNLVPPTPSYQLVTSYSVINAWVRNLTAQDTLQSVDIESYSKQMTVSNVAITHTVTQTEEALFMDFYLAGATQVLVDTVSDVANNIFFFSTSSETQGPNVLRNGVFQGNISIEPHQRWATGLLIENTTISAIPGSKQGYISLWNRGDYGTGQGWAIGWGVVWNATANEFTIQRPPGSENWCIGCVGTQETETAPGGSTVLPQGAIDSPGTYVYPASLYQAQLAQRLGAGAVPQ